MSKCRSVLNSKIQCCKCGKGFRLNHSKPVCGVCDTTAHAECIALSRIERELLKRGFRSLNCCKLPEAMTMPNQDLPHQLKQLATKSFVTPISIPNLLTCTCYECHRVIKKSSPSATSPTCTQSRHLACTYLPRQERESIRDGCREWRCCGTAQSPSPSTMPAPCQISESTMSHEVPIIHLKTKEDVVTNRLIQQQKFDETNRLLQRAPC